MSEETIIGPGPACPYCGEDYGQHTPDCAIKAVLDTQPFHIKTSISPIIVMKAALAHAILVGACDESIANLKAAIIHQQVTEEIAKELTDGCDDSKRDSPQKE